jgi:hypothetical protein
MKIAEWRQNRHQKREFAGRVRAGDGVILQGAGPGEINLLSVCRAQSEAMGRYSSFDALLRYGRDIPIGIFRKFSFAIPLTGRTIIMQSTLLKASDPNAWIS